MKNKRNEACLCLFGPLRSGLLRNVNQHGIDKDYAPTGHSGSAEESGLALAARTETYILRHSGVLLAHATHTNTLTFAHKTHSEKEADLRSVNKRRVRVQTCVVSV